MKNLFKFLVVGVVLGVAPQMAHCGPPGSEGPIFTDPKAQKEYERWQAVLKAGPYFKQVSRALPFNSELSGYIVKRELSDVGSSITAIRRKDKAKLSISVVSSTNAEIIKDFSNGFWVGYASGRDPYTEDSPSAKPLGQSSTQNINPETKMRYVLQVMDAPTLITLDMKAHLSSEFERDNPTWKPITKADQLFMEHLARIMLRRLKTLKLTHNTFKPK